jgi:hypothetical protein
MAARARTNILLIDTNILLIEAARARTNILLIDTTYHTILYLIHKYYIVRKRCWYHAAWYW